MGSPIKSVTDCLATCCADATCDTYQYCAGSAESCRASSGGGCWIGQLGEHRQCNKRSKAWVGRSGRGAKPAPTPAPGAPLTLTLNGGSKATPIPFKLGPNVDPDNNTLSVDSIGFILNGQRWYPISGEIHLARVPASQWKEELLRMKAGGLNSVAVYVFWIHHEQAEGQFNFTGRRDIRRFFQLAKQVGVRALLRAGPWDHGECRNGGHPDWLLAKSKSEHFALRQNNTGFMRYAKRWYAALAGEVKGLFFKDGGPIWGVQVDNETPDWHYLLALRDAALDVGMTPVSFTKTGWPSPERGYPADYPMLPFFGGYADLFWSNEMEPTPSVGSYEFNHGPSTGSRDQYVARSSKTLDQNARGGEDMPELTWTVPSGYPWIDVEIGGGMAAAYNHRVHMDPADMPAMHLVDVANGVNALGYYMYQGGNNPHPNGAGFDTEAPENTLQESSFQPAGAANPMPSFSYDFFAPLGEFGQPRLHFHQMRRLHVMVSDSNMAALNPTFPYHYEGGVRWAARSDGHSGFLFVNNYERLATLPVHKDVRFALTLQDNSTLAVPSVHSSPLTIGSGLWFAWPLNLDFSQATLAWATAQLICSVKSGPKSTLVLLAETPGVAIELGFVGAGVKVTSAHGHIQQEGPHEVVRGLSASLDVAASVTTSAGATVDFVVIPSALHDRVWKYETDGGVERVFIGELDGTELVLVEDGLVHLRGRARHLNFLVAPAFSSITVSTATPKGRVVGTTSVGVFSNVSVDVGPVSLPTAKWTLTQAPGPARDLPLNQRTKKAQEPHASEWGAAAKYSVMLADPGCSKSRETCARFKAAAQSNVDLRLAVDYHADAARVYLGDRCLTDNWYSGYEGDGQLQVGLDYLADENPGIWAGNLTMLVLPLKKTSLEQHVFLQKVLWPDFGTASTVCAVRSIDVIPTYKVSLKI